MAQSTITIRIDEQLKKDFDNFCSDVGINMTVAINLYMTKVVNEQRIPFEISKRPNEETIKAMEETEKLLKDPNTKAYNSFRELLEDIEDE